MRRPLTVLLAGISIAASLNGAASLAQSPDQPIDLAFEVASVKLNNSGGGRRFMAPMLGGQFTAANIPLSDLILFAYGLQGLDYRAIGIPPWAASTNYDVTARMDARHVQPDGGFAIDDVRAMTRTLLRDRFKLVARMERRDLPTYALVKARGDGKLGARLQLSGSTCPPITLPSGIPMPPPPPPPPGAGRDAVPPDLNCLGFAIPSHISARKTTMARFVDMLSMFVSRVVVDRTGLQGSFDLDLDYLPDPAIAPQGIGGRIAGAPPPPGVDTNTPEIFTALQEQLGLKLDSTKGPADVLVIDHVEHPTED